MNRRAMLLGAGGLVGTAVGAQVLAASPAAAAGAQSVFDVRSYGAGAGVAADDDSAFRQALQAARAATGGATVLVPPGSYRIATPLVLTAGITISAYGATITRSADCGAMVKNFAAANEVAGLAATPEAAGYSAPGSIAVLGGTWDMAGATWTAQADAMGFAHTSDVLVRDCTILNVPGAHAVELNAVRHAQVLNCVFDGLYGTDRDKEAVQITAATSVSNLPFPLYDNTPCPDVLISGCTLRDSAGQPWGVLCGDHGTFAGVMHTGIRVIGNHIESADRHGIRVSDWSNSLVSGNTIVNARYSGIYVQSHAANTMKGLVIEGNQILGTVETGSGGGIVMVGPGRPAGTVITGNTLTDTRGTAGVYLDSTDGSSVTGNTVNGTIGGGTNCQGIHFYRSVGGVIGGNTVVGADGEGIALDEKSYGVLVTGNQVTNAAMNGIWVASSDAVVRDNVITGANAAGGTARYGIRIGGNSTTVSCKGNVVRKAVIGAPVPAVTATAAIGVMPGTTAAWVTDNDLRGWGAVAISDAGSGTVTTGGNPG